jgi:hypothetical protein
MRAVDVPEEGCSRVSEGPLDEVDGLEDLVEEVEEVEDPGAVRLPDLLCFKEFELELDPSPKGGVVGRSWVLLTLSVKVGSKLAGASGAGALGSEASKVTDSFKTKWRSLASGCSSPAFLPSW